MGSDAFVKKLRTEGERDSRQCLNPFLKATNTCLPNSKSDSEMMTPYPQAHRSYTQPANNSAELGLVGGHWGLQDTCSTKSLALEVTESFSGINGPKLEHGV